MDKLSQVWNRIQQTLFPHLEETLDPLTKKQRSLAAILELVRIEDFIINERGWRGRPRKDRKALARAFVAKAVYNLTTTRALIDYLQSSANLRRLCGWERKYDVPHEALFSRAFAEFASTELPRRVHDALIVKYCSDRIVGHISRDSTAIHAREKPERRPNKKSLPRPKRKPGRRRKGEAPRPKPPTRLQLQRKMTIDEMIEDLPTVCDIGRKDLGKGRAEHWAGYKLHVDWADGGIPISSLLTSASLHDCQVAIPLAEMTARNVTSLYDLMDSAYDAKEIREHSLEMGHVPIIDYNRRRVQKIEMDPATAKRYEERTMAERGFSRLKDGLGGRNVRVRGPTKVMAHLMFGLLVIAAEQLLRLVA